MRGVNDRNFLNLWHILERATCAGPDQTRRCVGDVEWLKERHSFAGSDYSLSLEVHRLSRRSQGGAGWQFIVTIENWWNGNREVLRSTTWARVTAGDPKAVMAWVKQQEKAYEYPAGRGRT